MRDINIIEGALNGEGLRVGVVAARFNDFVVESLLRGAVDVLGAVIRGGAPHFEYVTGECVRGISQAERTHGVPVGFGVLTVDTIEQAIERAGTKAGNKDADAAISALEMANLLRKLVP